MRLLEGIAGAALLAIAVYSTREYSSSMASNLPEATAGLNVSIEAEDSAESAGQKRLNDAAWQKQLAEVGRSWQSEYCKWAWAHDLQIFPAVDSDPEEIARGDARELTARYFVLGREFTGRCRFTGEGRAIPERSRSPHAAALYNPRQELSTTNGSELPTRTDGQRPNGALLDGLVYGSPTGEPLPASDSGSQGNIAWFPILIVSLHGEPLHAPGEGYVPKYAYYSRRECMVATRRSIQEMSLAGIRGRFMCMYHGESDREMSRFPMENF